MLNDEAFDDALWGAFIVDVETEEVLYARNPSDLFIPASNMKLVTTAAALDDLGPDYRFLTRLYLDGDVEDGTLNGALVVRGGGDPRFGGRNSGRDLALIFQQWADRLKALGVHEVTGPLVVADDVMENPNTYFLSRLRRIFRNAEIDLLSDSLYVYTEGIYPDYSRYRLVATHESPRLSAFVAETNTDSNNLYAERILRTLAVHTFSSPGPVSAVRRRGAADPFMQRIGLLQNTYVVADGSGLSRDNRLTPFGIALLLQEMWHHPNPATREAFVRSLPVGGSTGTLRRRYASGDARGNVRAKTGYINSVRTLSGYVTTASGRIVVFSLLCNGYTVRTSRVNQAQDAVVELLADYEGRQSIRGSAMRRASPTPRGATGRQ